MTQFTVTRVIGRPEKRLVQPTCKSWQSMTQQQKDAKGMYDLHHAATFPNYRCPCWSVLPCDSPKKIESRLGYDAKRLYCHSAFRESLCVSVRSSASFHGFGQKSDAKKSGAAKCCTTSN